MPNLSPVGDGGRSQSPLSVCKDVLKVVSLPLIMVAGPIIALVGLITSLISNAMKLRDSQMLHDKKVEQKQELRGRLTFEESVQMTEEITNLKEVILKNRVQIKRDCNKWGKRMIPGLYGLEVAGNFLIKKGLLSFERATPGLSSSAKKALKELSGKDLALQEEVYLNLPKAKKLLMMQSGSENEKAKLRSLVASLQKALLTKRSSSIRNALTDLRVFMNTLSSGEVKGEGFLSSIAQMALEILCEKDAALEVKLGSLLQRAKKNLYDRNDLSIELRLQLRADIDALESAIIKESLQDTHLALVRLEKDLDKAERTKKETPREHPFSVEGNTAWQNWCANKDNSSEAIEAKGLVALTEEFLSQDSGISLNTRIALSSITARIEESIKNNQSIDSHLLSLHLEIESALEEQTQAALTLFSVDGQNAFYRFPVGADEVWQSIEQEIQKAGGLLLKSSGISDAKKESIKGALKKLDAAFVKQNAVKSKEEKNQIVSAALILLQQELS